MSIRFVTALYVVLHVGAGCGRDRRLPVGDGGGSAGDTSVTARDTGASGGDVATWSIEGARTGLFMYDRDANYVSCLLTPGGLLDMTTGEQAGEDPRLDVRITNYTGPGTFETTFGSGALGEGAMADVSLPGEYKYGYFFNDSVGTSDDVYSMCSMEVSESMSRTQASISCTGLVAKITSPDYDDRDALGLRPAVNLMASFDCAL